MGAEAPVWDLLDAVCSSGTCPESELHHHQSLDATSPSLVVFPLGRVERQGQCDAFWPHGVLHVTLLWLDMALPNTHKGHFMNN